MVVALFGSSAGASGWAGLAMLHTDVASWQSHRHSTHDRLMEDTSMGQYLLRAKEKRFLYSHAYRAASLCL